MIYTIGYTGRSMEEIQKLVEEKNAVLIDVRLVPFSRAPVWQKRSFQAAIPDYLHMKGFGNENYKSPMNGVRLHNPDMHLGTIRQLVLSPSRPRSIMLMCACEESARCHRTQVAQWICEQLEIDPRYNVENILPPPKKAKIKEPKIKAPDLQTGLEFS